MECALAAGCAISNSRRIAFPSFVTTIPVSNQNGSISNKIIRKEYKHNNKILLHLNVILLHKMKTLKIS